MQSTHALFHLHAKAQCNLFTYLMFWRFQLNDAYEEVDEQRQLVAQWKRKTQKAHGEMNDTKLLLEEQVNIELSKKQALFDRVISFQTSRNVLLEKKQRKFDAEIGSLQEERRTESASKERILREMDEVKRVKYSLEDQIQVSQICILFNYVSGMEKRSI